jgi:hypothetical protein
VRCTGRERRGWICLDHWGPYKVSSRCALGIGFESGEKGSERRSGREEVESETDDGSEESEESEKRDGCEEGSDQECDLDE